VQPLPEISISGDTEVCEGEEINLIANGAASYTWVLSNGLTIGQGNAHIKPAKHEHAGVWTVTGVLNGCQSSKSVIMVVHDKPSVSVLASDSILRLNNSATLTASGSGVVSYAWVPTTGLDCNNCESVMASPDQTTTYCVIGTTVDGCSDTACVKIFVDRRCKDLYIPSAFSPNGDEENDVWKIESPCIKEITLMIYNRWGEKLFETTDLNKGWDGTYKGQPVEIGVYSFIAIYRTIDGLLHEVRGGITLIR
jgi:gliding motility-associated-like protein